MPDEDISALLRDLGRPVAPSASFGDDLFDQLVDQIDFERARTRPAAGHAWIPVLGSSWRRLGVVLLVLLLLAGLVGSAILSRPAVQKVVPIATETKVRADPTANPDPLAIDPITRSQAVFRDPPPFDITLNSAGTSIRFQYDGTGLLHGTRLGSGSFYPLLGSSFVFDGRTFFRFAASGDFEGAVNAVNSSGQPQTGLLGQSRPSDPLGHTSPLAAFPLAWPYEGDGDDPSIPPCEAVVRLGAETIAGRAADHVSCHSSLLSGDYWIDQETGFLLEVAQPSQAPIIATTVHVGSQSSPDTFSVPQGPSGEPPLERGAMPAGTYATVQFWAPLLITVPAGWSDGMEAPRSGQIAGPEQSFVAWTMPVLVSANGQKEIAIQGRTSHQLLDWLRRNSPGLVGAGSATTFAGHDAVEFDVHLNRGDACDTRLRAGCPFQAQEPDRWISHGLVVPVGQRLIAFVYRAPTAQGLDVARAELGRIRFQ